MLRPELLLCKILLKLFAPLFLAYRYVVGGPQGRGQLKSLIHLCFGSIVLSSFALTLALCITKGFERDILQGLQNLQSDAVVESNHHYSKHNQMKAWLLKRFGSEVSLVVGQASSHALLSNDSKDPILIKGFDIDVGAVINLGQKVCAPGPMSALVMAKALRSKQGFVGQGVAQRLGLKVGDNLVLLIPKVRGRRVVLHEKKIPLAGILHTGNDEYDLFSLVCSLELFAELFPDKNCANLLLRLKRQVENHKEDAWWQRLGLFMHSDCVSQSIARLKEQGLPVKGWQEVINQDVLRAIKLEQFAIFMALALLVILAFSGLGAVLLAQLEFKKRDVAILELMHMARWQIRQVFYWMGLYLIFVGTLVGQALAFVVGFMVKSYLKLDLPDVYYSSSLPVDLRWSYFALVLLGMVVIGLIFMVVILQGAFSLKPGEVVRQG